MKYISHETWEDSRYTVWTLTVAVRRWWAPWTWRTVELIAVSGALEFQPHAGQWAYRNTGMSVSDDNYNLAQQATALLCVTLLEQRRADELISEDEPPKLRALTGGRR